jgi:hypothetical protein
VVFGVQEVSGALVTLSGWGRDARLGLEVGDWVELVDDLTAIRDADEDPAVPPQRLHQVVALDVADRVVTLDADPNDAPTGTPPRPVTGDPALHPYLRRWDHRPAQGAEALPVVLDTWIPLEDGVEVRFSAPPAATAAAPATFRRGDHWLVPARVVPGDVVWPQVDGAPAAVVPHGVDYHYVLLGVFANGKVDGGALSTFAPLFK